MTDISGIVIRSMIPSDERTINEALTAQGWERRTCLYLQYIADEKAGLRTTFVAERGGVPLGYLTLLHRAEHGPFAGQGLPEITDFNVFFPYRRQGIGARLMEAAEEKAAQMSNVVTIGFGLHSGYGAAQRIYVKRGYVPDGSGVWYQNRCLGEGEPCFNDDDLVLYLSKQLR